MALACFGMSVCAQTFQSGFDALQFDRSKGPATLHAGVEVDAATGAINLQMPLGPGIGARGAVYQPAITGYWQPNINTEQGAGHREYSPQWEAQWRLPGCHLKQRPGVVGDAVIYNPSTVVQRPGSFSLSPGYLELSLSSSNDTTPSVHLPNGDHFTFGGADPNSYTKGKAWPSDLLNGADPLKVLSGLDGYASGWQVMTTAATWPGLCMGSGGQLVMALESAAEPRANVACIVQNDGNYGTLASLPVSAPYPYDSKVAIPRRWIVVIGDTAYEYKLAALRYVNTDVSDLDSNNAANLVNTRTASAARYRLTRILNRFGEWVDFQYESATPFSPSKGTLRRECFYPFTATWHSPAQSQTPSIHVTSSAVTYSGGSPAPSFALGLSTSVLSGGGWAEGDTLNYRAHMEFQPVDASNALDVGDWDIWGDAFLNSVSNTATGQGLSIQYASWTGIPGGTILPTIISSIQVPGKTLNFHWASYSYRKNQLAEGGFGGYVGPNDVLSTNATGGYSGSSPMGILVGVDRIDEISGPGIRTTLHARTTPIPGGDPRLWNNTTFQDIITHPDGQVTAIRYVSPVQGSGSPYEGASLADQLQTLAHLKHQVQEMREYPRGVYSAADWAGPASSSQAVKVVFHDRWDNHAYWNPLGLGELNPVPFATRSRTWDKDRGTFETSASLNWDSISSGWKLSSTAVETMASAPTVTIDPLGLEMSSPTRTETFVPGAVVEHDTLRTFDSAPLLWSFGRVVSETATRNKDLPGSMGASSALPYTSPAKTITRLNGSNLTSSIQLGDPAGLWTRTDFTYGSATPVTAADVRLKSVTLSGANGSVPMPLSGQVGVDDYAYDPTTGAMASILQKGATWRVYESRDALGQVQNQTDGNGLTVTYTHDELGRVTSIQPPNGEVATTVAYLQQPDGIQVTLTKGSNVSVLKYNGFGEIIREARQGAASQWSHRRFGYDAGGRQIWGTTWLDTDGATNDGGWTATLAPGDHYVNDGPPECVEYQYNPKTRNMDCISWDQPMVLALSTFATHNTYDERGRLYQSVSPTGLTTLHAYLGMDHGISVGADTATATTWYHSDLMGRLVKVVDALNQVPEYRYDPADRIAEVRQYPTSSGTALAAAGTGTPQLRSWSYDAFGRMTSLTQPESGTTTYANFTVSGKPQTTVYGAGSAAPRTVTTTFDALGRVGAVSSSDNSVTQSFIFGDQETGHGLANGKLVRATAGGVARVLDYNGLNGRLSALTRNVDGLSWLQSMSWNTDGTLATRTYPDGRVQGLSYDAYKTLPNGTSFGGSSLASMAYDPTHWGLAGMTWAPSNAMTTFRYDTDQVRLLEMIHSLGATPTRDWKYTYDSRGNLLNDGEDYYGYDLLNRLSMALVWDPFTGAGQGLQQTFSYDAFGNRKALSTQGTTNWAKGTVPPTSLTVSGLAGDKRDLRSYTMASAELATMASTNRLPATLNGVATGAAHDAQGNLTGIYRTPGLSSTQLLMSYDALGRVSTMSDSLNATSATYLHDDEGLRIKIVDSKSGKTTYNVYNEAHQLIATYEKIGTGSLTWKKDIVYVGSKEVAEVDNANKTWVTFVDHLGSPRLIWDGIANPVKGTNLIEQKFMPFGEGLAPTTGIRPAKGFTNHEQTDDSGLIYMQARFYAPWFGRFLSPDPKLDQHFKDTQSWNIYSYVRNNPVSRIDPTGEQVYVVMYDPNQRSFKAAAETRAKEIQNGKGFDAKKDTVLLRGVNTKEAFLGAIKEANGLDKQFGKVQELSIFSHSGTRDGPIFRGGRTPNESQFIDRKEITKENLQINWSSTAVANFYGCHSNDFAREFGKAQSVDTRGFTGTTSVSRDPHEFLQWLPGFDGYQVQPVGQNLNTRDYLFKGRPTEFMKYNRWDANDGHEE